MRGFIKTILSRPASVFVCVLALVLFGVSSLLSMELERVPDSSYPSFWIEVYYTGVGPEEMDSLITSKLEKNCKTLKGYKEIDAYTEVGWCYVEVDYEYGTDLKEAKEELQNVLNITKAEIPADTEIYLHQDSTNDQSIFEVSILSDDKNVDVRSYVKQQIEPELKKIDGVGTVQVRGGADRYISIELVPDAVAQYGLDVSSVADIISNSSYTIPAGSLSYGDQTINVSSSVKVSDVEDIRNIPIKLDSGEVIHIYDIADVHFSDVKIDYFYRSEGKDGIDIRIKKKQKANVVSLGKELREFFDVEAETHPEMIFKTTKDDSIPIQRSIQNIFFTLLLGIILSMVVLFVFFGDLRASLIVGSSMPVSLLATFIMMSKMGYTLNLVTMSSLVIGIGMMVDNAIVVLEMCFVKKDSGLDFGDAAFEGTTFVFTDIVASTLTSVVVYIPLVSLKGMAGIQFGPLGWTIMFALTASLASALTIVPLAFSIYKPVEKKTLWINKVLEKMGNVYARFMPHLLKHRFIVTAVSLILVACSAYLFTGFEFDTANYEQDYKAVDIILTFKPGTSMEAEDEVVRHYEEFVSKDEDIDYYYSYVMSGSCEVIGVLPDNSEVSPDEVGERWSEELEGYDDRCSASIGYGMGEGGPSAEVLLTAENYEELREALSEVEKVAQKIDGVTNVKNALHSGGFKADVVVDPEMATKRGFGSAKELSEIVSDQLDGKKALDVIVDDVKFEAKAELPEDMRSNISNLKSMSFRNSEGNFIPFSDVAHVEYKNIPFSIEKTNGKYSGKIVANCSEDDIYSVKEELTKEVRRLKLPKGVTIEETETEMQTREAMSETSMAIAAAVFLVFMVLAIQFDSIRFSLLVMMCLPFALIGAMPLLNLGLDYKIINLSTMVGFLMLGGIVVNDGIMYVDTANDYRKTMPVRDALILAGRSRMRPILMTTLTTVFSMIPMIIPGAGGDPAMRGLAFVVIGGLAMATVLTLIILPVFYQFFCGKDDFTAP